MKRIIITSKLWLEFVLLFPEKSKLAISFPLYFPFSLFILTFLQIQTGGDKKRISINEYYNIEALDPSNPSEYLENNNMFTTHNFTFDRVYDPNSTQSEVYDYTAKPAVMSVLQVL